MREWFRRVAEYVRTMFGNLGAAQKVVVVALAVLIVGAIVWAATSLTSNGWTRIAGIEISREERDQILKKLQEKSIPYELRNEEIYVPKEVADQAVIELHGEGLYSDAMLWKFLDESNLTASKWQQEKRYQVALQRKLERMIRGIKSIRHVSVQLTPGEQAQALGFPGKGPTASVSVELHSGRELTRANVVAIARLVANSMTGMEAHHVLIMDNAGRPYRLPQAGGDWDLAENRLDLERQYDEYYQVKVQRLYPDAMVAPSVELSSDAVKEIEEIVGKPVAVEEEGTQETDRSKTGAGTVGIKGEAPLVSTVGGTIEMNKESREDRTRSYVPRKVIERHIREGKVTAKTVSVVFPVFVGENENVEAVIQREQAKVPAYQQSVMAAVGLKEASSCVVTFMPTRKPAAVAEPSFGHKAWEFAERWGGTVTLLVLALIALIIVYGLLRRAIPKGGLGDLEALRKRMTEEVSGPTVEAAMAEEEVGRVKLSIREMVQKSPRSGAAILKAWLGGK